MTQQREWRRQHCRQLLFLLLLLHFDALALVDVLGGRRQRQVEGELLVVALQHGLVAQQSIEQHVHGARANPQSCVGHGCVN